VAELAAMLAQSGGTPATPAPSATNTTNLLDVLKGQLAQSPSSGQLLSVLDALASPMSTTQPATPASSTPNLPSASPLSLSSSLAQSRPIRRTTGIPRSQLQRVSGPHVRNAMLHRDGHHYVLRGTLSSSELASEKAVLDKPVAAPPSTSPKHEVAAVPKDPRQRNQPCPTPTPSRQFDTPQTPPPSLPPTLSTLDQPQVSDKIATSQLDSALVEPTAPDTALTQPTDPPVPTTLSPVAFRNVPLDVYPYIFKGARLTAQDYVGSWLPATIIRLDKPNNRIRVHFEGWSRKFDEWLPVDVGRLKPRDEKLHPLAKPRRKKTKTPKSSDGNSPDKKRLSELDRLKFDHPGKRSLCPEVGCVSLLYLVPSLLPVSTFAP
jgi:hypothetical protein